MSTVIWALRLMGAAVLIPFAIDQLMHPAEWTEYVPGWLHPMLPGWPAGFMRVHALGNLVIGVWLLSGIFTKAAAGVSVLWMVTIVGGVLLTGKWQLAVRDFAVTLGLLALFVAV